MGQKVHPVSFRLGLNASWLSKWFASPKRFADMLHNDIVLREALKKRLAGSGVSKIEIERKTGEIKAHIFTSKPGIIIGRKGASIEKLREDLSRRFGEKIDINIVEVSTPDKDGQLIAQNIAEQIERRVAYRRAAKQSIQRAMEGSEVKGIKIRIAGRLNGADISRAEFFKEGNIPLHTLRSQVELGVARANTTYGVIGIKVWLYKGQVFGSSVTQQDNKSWLAQTSRSKKKPANSTDEGRLSQELMS